MTEETEKPIKDTYVELKGKYSLLPDYDVINHEFEICLIDKHDFLLRSVIRRIIERFEGYCMLIEELMQGDSKMSNMTEWRSMNDDTKKSILETYRQLMIEMRSALETSLETSEEKEAELVKRLFDKWLAVKPELKRFVTGLKDSWKEDKSISEKLEYMG